MKAFRFNNHWKIIFVAAIFNLSFEYAFRGYSEFLARPLQTIFLFGTYFALYTILEDVIVRFKLSNYQLVLAIWPLGLIPMALGTGVLFYQPQLLGINWINFFFITFLWWGILQAIFTFYFANRIAPRNWDHPRLGRIGWTLALGFLIGGFVLIKIMKPPVSPGTPIGYLIWLILSIIPIVYLYYDIHKRKQQQKKPWTFTPSRVLDFLSFGSLALFLFLGTYLGDHQTLDQASSSFINPTALLIINRWTFIYSVVFLLNQWLKKKDVTI